MEKRAVVETSVEKVARDLAEGKAAKAKATEKRDVQERTARVVNRTTSTRAREEE